MGMFDWYIPEPKLNCPVCNTQMEEWQGKDSSCCLLVWRQGTRHPIDQNVDEECRISEKELSAIRLPEAFTIYANDCQCPYFVVAHCYSPNGAWLKTEVENASNVKQAKMKKEEFKNYLAWLESAKKT